jgi:hypothetical protein
MGLFSRNVRKFTTAESFCLYMEGLRSLQLYEELASNSSIAQPVSKAILDMRLNDAARNLSACVATYPEDLLPRYYYGILLSTQAQRIEAVQLQAYLANQAPAPWPSTQADGIYKDSASEFDEASARSQGETRTYAQYNRAQVLAKMNNPEGWDIALKILRSLIVPGYEFSGSNKNSQTLIRGPRWSPGTTLRLVWRGETGGDIPGAAASASTYLAEKSAFNAQLEMLIWFLQLRQAARGGSLNVGLFPLPPASEPPQPPEPDSVLSEVGLHRINDFQDARDIFEESAKIPKGGQDNGGAYASKQLISFISTIEQRALPAQAKSDLTADYWNKWSRVALEFALRPGHSQSETLKLLQLAANYASESEQEKGTNLWIPALLNQAFASALAGSDAQPLLAAVVGQDQTVPLPPPTKTTDVTAIVNYILQMPSGTSAGTIANLVLRAFGPLKKNTLQEVVRGLDYDKLRVELIDEISQLLFAHSSAEAR